MGIKDEIFEEFFGKLEKDKKVPDLLVLELKKLRKNRNMNSQEKIFKAIREGSENANKN